MQGRLIIYKKKTGCKNVLSYMITGKHKRESWKIMKVDPSHVFRYAVIALTLYIPTSTNNLSKKCIYFLSIITGAPT